MQVTRGMETATVTPENPEHGVRPRHHQRPHPRVRRLDGIRRSRLPDEVPGAPSPPALASPYVDDTTEPPATNLEELLGVVERAVRP